jgi:lysophospholipase L1-like esterase
MMNFFLFLRSRTACWILFPLIVGLPCSHIQAGPLTNIFYLGDSYLDDGNYKFITAPNGTGPAFSSNSPPWSSVVNEALGLPHVGRWTNTGSHPPLGNNYAVCGAGINNSPTSANTSLHGQITKLRADYPHGLPANSLVVIAIGTNDILQVVGLGGMWSTSISSWKTGSSAFAIPAVGASVTVPVANTAGLAAGPTNFVILLVNSQPVILALTGVDVKGSTVTFTNKYDPPGFQIGANASFEICAKWFMDQGMQTLASDIKSLVTDRAEVVLVLLPQTDMLPFYNRQPNEALAHQTWKYYYDKMRDLIPGNFPQLLSFDLKPVFQEVFSEPTRYGFKVNYPGWLGTSSPDPNEYMFWDPCHPSGLMHRHIAQRFLEFLRAHGFSSPSQ